MNQVAADPTAHRFRLNKEVVELSVVPGGSPGGEPKELARVIHRDSDAPGFE